MPGSSDHGPASNGAGQQPDSPSDDYDMVPRDAAIPDNSSVPKPKRLACMICRKRKLKCDGVRPSCSTCSRLGHSCAYDEQRRKSGPKRGYVKALEERLSKALSSPRPHRLIFTFTIQAVISSFLRHYGFLSSVDPCPSSSRSDY
jgi:hypothetical protein